MLLFVYKYHFYIVLLIIYNELYLIMVITPHVVSLKAYFKQKWVTDDKLPLI